MRVGLFYFTAALSQSMPQNTTRRKACFINSLTVEWAFLTTSECLVTRSKEERLFQVIKCDNTVVIILAMFK